MTRIVLAALAFVCAALPAFAEGADPLTWDSFPPAAQALIWLALILIVGFVVIGLVAAFVMKSWSR